MEMQDVYFKDDNQYLLQAQCPCQRTKLRLRDFAGNKIFFNTLCYITGKTKIWQVLKRF